MGIAPPITHHTLQSQNNEGFSQPPAHPALHLGQLPLGLHAGLRSGPRSLLHLDCSPGNPGALFLSMAKLNLLPEGQV